MYRYEPEVLRRLQNTQKEILKRVDAICEKYGIDYFVVFGTAIGTIRHKGFIPWDDDIDIGMLREDYERLKQVPAEEWGDYTLSDSTDRMKQHVLIYPQVYRNGTVFETEHHATYDKKDPSETLPIWIDIFIYDYVKSPEDAERKIKKAHFTRKMFYYAKYGTRVIKTDPFSHKLACFFKNLCHVFLNLRKDPDVRLYRKYVKLLKSEKTDYITTFDTSVPKEIIRSVMPVADFFPTVRVPFEDITVRISNHYDEMLRKIYGDYMVMPPEEKRVNHPPRILDFGDGKGNVIC